MLMYLFFSFLSFFAWLSPNYTPLDATSSLSVKVKDISKKEGFIRVAIYKNTKDFLKDKGQFIGKSLPVTSNEMVINFDKLPYDTYAIAVYHDLNSNFKFDTNFFGVPTESYGFAKTPKSKWRAPYFKEVGLSISSPNKEVTVSIKKWLDY